MNTTTTTTTRKVDSDIIEVLLDGESIGFIRKHCTSGSIVTGRTNVQVGRTAPKTVWQRSSHNGYGAWTSQRGLGCRTRKDAIAQLVRFAR